MSERLDKLYLCPEIREAIILAKKQISEKSAHVIVCRRCLTKFDITSNGAFPIADFCSYGTSQLNDHSQPDGFTESIK